MAKHRQNKNVSPSAANPRGAQKPKNRSRNIFIISFIVVVIVAVVGLSGWGIYHTQFQPYQPIAMIYNGVELNMRYFTNTVKLYYGNAPSDSKIADLADYVIQQIEQNQLIIQGAEALGMKLDRDAVKAELKKADKPVTRESMDILLAQDILNKQILGDQPQYHVQIMLLESDKIAQAAIARLQSGEPFEQVAVELSKFTGYTVNKGDMGWVTAHEANLSLGSTKFNELLPGAQVGTVSGPFFDDSASKQYGYWVNKAVEIQNNSENASQQIANIQGILLGSEQDAQDVINKLKDGADINELAKQVSQHPYASSVGADLGWIAKSENATAIDKIFDVPVNTVIGPISDNLTSTKGGYWVYNVVEKNDSKALTSYQENTLEQDFLTRCSEALAKSPDYKVEKLLNQEMIDFALNEAVNAQGKGSVMISASTIPDCEVGVPYHYKFGLYGQKEGNTWSITAGDLPEGITFDTVNGVLSGTPKVGGAYSFTLKVTNNIHYWEQEFVLTMRLPITITNESLSDGKVGEIYTGKIETYEDNHVIAWKISEGALPEGLSIDEASGSIYGTPENAGAYTFTVQVDDGLAKATKQFTINITPADSNPEENK